MLGTQVTADAFSQTQKTGTGDLVLQGYNIFGGGLEIAQGRVVTQAAGGLSGTVTINSGTSFVLDTLSTDIIYGGILQGAGSVLKQSAGTARVNYLANSGGTTVAAGTLRVGSSGTAPTIFNDISVQSGATLIVETSSGVNSTARAVSGAGTVQKEGADALSFTSLNTTGAVNVNGGTLTIGAGSAIGSLSVATGATATAVGSLIVRTGGTTTGAGTINHTGGTLDMGTVGGFTGNVVSSGATVAGRIAAGTTYSGNVTGTGTGHEIVFAGTGASATDRTVSGALSTQGTLTFNLGTFTLTGTGQAATATVQLGTLTVGNGGTGGSLTANSIVLASGTLRYAQSDDMTVASVFSNAGTANIAQIGTGTLTLSGTSTAYTGTLAVQTGTMNVTGNFQNAAVAVNAGTLAGSGRVGAVTLASGAHLAPGNGIGTLSTGALTLATGAVVDAELLGQGIGQYDSIAVTGSVNLASARLALAPGQGYEHTLNASFVLVQNDGVDAIVGTFLDLEEGERFAVGERYFSISYIGGDGNDVALTAVAAPSSGGSGGTNTGTVDGADVSVTTGIRNGTSWTTTTVTPPAPGAGGEDGYSTVPLASTNGTPVLTAQIPAGVGGTFGGPSAISTGDFALTQLISEIGARSDDPSLIAGAQLFFGTAPAATVVMSVVPTAPVPGSQPLALVGAPQTGVSTAVIIDSSGLPPGTVLNLDNIDFAALIGAMTVRGGAGDQIVFGDSASQNILLGEGDDELHGGGGDDIIGSDGGNDLIFGDAGNDVVFGGAGNDRIDGGTGRDTVVFSGGSLDDYRLQFSNGVAVFEHRNGGSDGTDTVSAVEVLRFNGADLRPEGAVARLYEALLDRAASDSDLDYWAGHIRGGASLNDIAATIAGSPEAATGIGALDDSGFVAALYTRVLDRPADAAGLEFWRAQLAGGSLTRGDAALAFAQSAERLAVPTEVAFGDTDAGTIMRIYAGLLDRDADEAGLNYWLDVAAGGASRKDIAAAFLAAPELQGVNALDDAGFVAALYRSSLERDAVAGEVSYWSQRLQDGSADRAGLALTLAEAPEAVALMGEISTGIAWS